MDTYPEIHLNVDEIPQSIRWLRSMRNMTLKKVAATTGLSLSFISDMERGRVRPSLATLQKLAEAYNAPLLLRFG